MFRGDTTVFPLCPLFLKAVMTVKRLYHRASGIPTATKHEMRHLMLATGTQNQHPAQRFCRAGFRRMNLESAAAAPKKDVLRRCGGLYMNTNMMVMVYVNGLI